MITAKGSGEPIDARLVRKLADILHDTGLTEIEVERGDLKIRVARTVTVSAQAVQVAAPAQYAPAPAQLEAPTSPAPAPVAAPAAVRAGDIVKSPMVGTVYHQAQPGSDPFCKPGDKVVEGQTLLIVEAMKTMNPIPAPRSGTVVEILVADGDPIEYGEPLVVLE
jgi:acetyl-CoA carboxylase biotin carboxyl carrier protein